MATRVNMLKLLQEVRGFADLANRRIPPRPTNPLLLQFRPTAGRTRRKWVLGITILEPVDIPEPVPIRFLDASTKTSGQSAENDSKI